MTNKTQTMLTIALTVAVSGLLVVRIIEPAQAADCATVYDVMDIGSAVNRVGTDVVSNQDMLIEALVRLDGIQIGVESQ